MNYDTQKKMAIQKVKEMKEQEETEEFNRNQKMHKSKKSNREIESTFHRLLTDAEKRNQKLIEAKINKKEEFENELKTYF